MYLKPTIPATDHLQHVVILTFLQLLSERKKGDVALLVSAEFMGAFSFFH